jgi:hypothetical protein
MAGFAFQLVDLPGDLAVVIWGERDCVNAFPRQHTAMAREPRWRVYAAAVREDEAVAGRAEERLRDCLRFVAADARPRAIVVLTTCLTETTGASPETVCAQVQTETGLRVLPVHTSGLRLKTQVSIGDSLARLLVAELGSTGAPDPSAVNLVGYQTDRPPDTGWRTLRDEAADVLGRVGLRLNAAAPLGADLDEWVALPKGGLTVVPERAQYATLAGLLEARGCRVAEVAAPVGLAATDAFYGRIAELAGRDVGTVLRALPARAEASRRLEATRERLAGRRIAYGIGSHHNFRPDQLAAEGLGDLPLLLEAGLGVELVIQERDTAESRGRIRANLAALGLDLPWRLFDEPAVLAPVLDQGRYDGACLSDFLADQAGQAGVPLVALGGPRSGYVGAAMACKSLLRVLDGEFQARYGRFL